MNEELDWEGKTKAERIQEKKDYIDTMDLYFMESKLRRALPGDEYLHGEVGKYFRKVLNEKRKENES